MVIQLVMGRRRASQADQTAEMDRLILLVAIFILKS